MIDVAKRFNIPHAVETPSELFKLVDAVVICTPNKFHADLSIEALNHGVHVLCEKPMAMTTEECDRMIEAANKAMRRRKVPGWGVFTNKALQGGGSLIDYGCHLLDLSLWLLGKDMVPHEVLGKTYNQLSKQPNQINDWGTFDHTKFDVDDHVTSYMTFANRASMQFECSWSANIKEDKVHVSLSGEDGGINLFPFEIYEPRFGTIFESKANVEHNEDIAGERQARNFVNACLGIEEIVVKPEEARNVNALIEAIYRSDLDNKSIQL